MKCPNCNSELIKDDGDFISYIYCLNCDYERLVKYLKCNKIMVSINDMNISKEELYDFIEQLNKSK